MTRYSSTMSEILSQIREGFSPKEIKMAIGIASDKRYAGGNYTGAVRQIEKIKKGLSDHPQVKAVLKRQNEQDEPASPDEGSMAIDQLEFIEYATEKMKEHIQNGGEFPEWMQNKLSGTHEKMKSLYANIEHGEMEEVKEEVELEEAKEVLSRFRDDKLKQNIMNLAKQSGLKVKDMGDKIEISGNARRVMDITLAVQKQNVKIEELEEGKSSTGYELYHKDFSSAMKHAYDFAKKKFGIEVDPKEIDDKVASGPRKPSKGKTNSYRLLGKDGKKAIQVQVYGMDNGKYELNMYKEEVEMTEGAFGELQIAAKDLAKYAAKDKKGMDYKDFMKAAAMMKTGKVKELAKFTMDLDTEPRDHIIMMVKDAIGKSAAEKLFNVSIREEDELDEAQDTWMVKVVKGVNKVKAGDFVKVKARNVPEALKKAIKQFGDPNLNAVPSTHFKVQKEEVELEEKLKVSDGLGAWIDDFKKSDAPQFQGKSDEQKKKMAIAAFVDAGGKLESVNEMREPYAVIDTADGNKVVGTASDEKGAKSIITSAELPPMKIKDKKTLKIVKVKKKQMIGQPIKEEEEPKEPEQSDGAKAVAQARDDKKKTRIAQLQLQIAKAQETINKLNAQEKPSE